MNSRFHWLRALIAILMVAVLAVIAFKIDNPLYTVSEEASEDGEGETVKKNIYEPAQEKVSKRSDDDALIIWYTDEALTDYISTLALSYQSEYGIRVKPEYRSGVEFLEQINHASVYEGTEENGEMVYAPDMYITTHDNLMKAYYTGLASEISDPQHVINSVNYPATSIHAVTCDGKRMAYPLYYETNFFLYNKTYMANIAKQKIDDQYGSYEAEEETNQETGTESDNEAVVSENQLDDELDDMPMGDEEVDTDPLVLEKLSTMIPSTIDDILTFANNYDAPEQVESVFKWDVSDIFYNYFFVGNYMDVGGEDGDDNTYFNIYNQQAVDCLTVYQNINQFFSIDSKSVNYDNILDDFIKGKTVFTVATTDAIAKIKSARENGEFEYEYGVAVLPDISSTLKARGLSETSTIVINGYSMKKEAANDFAEYLAYTKSADLYKKAGKISCLKNVEYEDSEITNIMQEYEKSVPLPKMIEASNYWVQLEIAFTKIWNGEDPDATLKELNDTIGSQIEEIEYHVPTQESIKVGAD